MKKNEKMERYRILIWIGVIHHDTFRFPGAIKIEILKRRFIGFFKISGEGQ